MVDGGKKRRRVRRIANVFSRSSLHVDEPIEMRSRLFPAGPQDR